MKLLSRTTAGPVVKHRKEKRMTEIRPRGYSHRNSTEKSKYGIFAVFFVFGFLVLATLVMIAWQTDNGGIIKIDGKFDDWLGVAKTTKERDLSVPENIDIAEYATAEAGKNVAFYAKVY
ncbi:MAG: hypothetical protein QXD15_06855, partial [Thermoplasmata archaeon]